MRRDLIIGLLCSLLLHGGLAWLGNIDFGKGNKKKVAKEDVPTIELQELPKMEPEEPEAPDPSELSSDPTIIAPPSVADVPGVVSFDSFVQPVQPPPPPKAKIDMTAPKAQGPSAAGLKDVFDLKNLDQQPVMRSAQKPVYPFEMKRQSIEGEVLVQFICDEKGETQEVRVVKSTNVAFNAAAIEAVSKWRFRPGKKGGRAVNVRMQVPLTFKLTEDE